MVAPVARTGDGGKVGDKDTHTSQGRGCCGHPSLSFAAVVVVVVVVAARVSRDNVTW